MDIERTRVMDKIHGKLIVVYEFEVATASVAEVEKIKNFAVDKKDTVVKRMLFAPYPAYSNDPTYYKIYPGKENGHLRKIAGSLGIEINTTQIDVDKKVLFQNEEQKK